jgi:hypothetical protein
MTPHSTEESMDERDGDTRRDEDPSAAPVKRLPYTAPALVEYGNVAKLTQAGGNTVVEHGHARKNKE